MLAQWFSGFRWLLQPFFQQCDNRRRARLKAILKPELIQFFKQLFWYREMKEEASHGSSINYSSSIDNTLVLEVYLLPEVFNGMAKATTLSPVSNDAESVIEIGQPYIAAVGVAGTSPFLFHRWSVEGVEAKAGAAKGSKAKKTDDVESYVYRKKNGDVNSELCIPGEYLRMAIIGAAKFRQDPRSPRKSAMDLFKAGVVAMEPLCSLGVVNWDYLDRRRVMIQRNGITRSRPAMDTGWKTEFLIQVLLPEYISQDVLNEVIQSAGRLIGIGDFRPTYGRFQVTSFKVS